MEFACSVCQYTSSKKEHVVRHVSRKTPCGLGIKEIVEIPIEIKCEYCNKNFATYTSLKLHKKNNCKQKDKLKDEEIRKLKEEIKELEKRPTTINNSINNTINAYVNNYEDTDMEKMTDKIYNTILKDSEEIYKIIPRLIKHIHCNPDMPENHNIRLSNRNKNNKYLEVYKNNHWEIEDKKTEIGNIISDKETNLSDWIDSKGEKYQEALEKFTDYLEQKYDEETATLIREEVELLLYNNRKLTKN